MRIFLVLFLLLSSPFLEAKSLFGNDEQLQNSIYTNALKDLIIATQKIRGLTNSYINGNTSAMLLVYAERDEMKNAIGEMEATTLAADPVINARATAISQALIKLNHKAFKMKAEEAFSAYTEQIGDILMLAQTVSKRLSSKLTPCGKDGAHTMMEIMLPLTENVGQLRGFGAGLAAKKHASKKELAKLNVLVKRVKAFNKKMQNQITTLAENYPKKVDKSILTDAQNINTKILAYTSLVQNRFKTKKILVNPDNFFDEGTDIISNIVTVYNKINKAVLKDSKGWF
ncbi:nitrate- and nitrite sensing domain-containing protein [Sulfurimonas sp.]